VKRGCEGNKQVSSEQWTVTLTGQVGWPGQCGGQEEALEAGSLVCDAGWRYGWVLWSASVRQQCSGSVGSSNGWQVGGEWRWKRTGSLR